MNRNIINTQRAPSAIGAYNQGISINGFVFTSGQISLNPMTNQLVEGDVENQVNQVFENLNAVCEAGNSSLKNAVKLTVFLTDIKLAPYINGAIEKWFNSSSYPARTMIEASRLPLNASIEIECIAIQND